MFFSVDDIIGLHLSEGEIEDAYVRVHIDNRIMMLNKFTLRVRRGNAPREEIKAWNLDIHRNIKKDRNLLKEIKEYISVFQLFERLKIKSGYIKKSETPDFILTRNGEKTGIEITKIYIGNDWAAEKLNEEIKEFRLRKNEVEGYMEYKKYQDKVTTYRLREGLMIMPNTSEITIEDYIVELKNKIFTKIRKLSDDYNQFENNIIYVDVFSSSFFKEKFDKNKMCEELNFYVDHIEGDFSKIKAKVILKLGNELIEYDLTNRNYKVI